MFALLNKIMMKFVIKSPVNVIIGRKLFYNNGGVISNVIGRYIKKRDVKKSKKLGFHCKRSRSVDDLINRGFLVTEKVTNEAVMASLAEIWDSWANEQELPDDGRLELSSADHSESINDFLPLLQKLITKEVEDTLESYFESYSRIINFHIYRNRKAVNRSELDSYGATAQWHLSGSPLSCPEGHG